MKNYVVSPKDVFTQEEFFQEAFAKLATDLPQVIERECQVVPGEITSTSDLPQIYVPEALIIKP